MQKETPRRTIVRAGASAALPAMLGCRVEGVLAQTGSEATPMPRTNKEHDLVRNQSEEDIQALRTFWVNFWNGDFAAAFSEYSFTTIVGAIENYGILAGRWTCRGLHNGSTPGSSAEAEGTEIVFEGADFLRVEGGKLVEYRLSADTLRYLQQIGVIPV